MSAATERLADLADDRMNTHGTDDALGLVMAEASVLLSLASEGLSR